MDADSVIRARVARSQGSSVRALLDDQTADATEQNATQAGLSSPDELQPLPLPGAAYEAFSRASNKPQLTVCFLLADATIKGLAYANLDSIDLVPGGSPGVGPAIVARFAGGMGIVEVRIEGRNLMVLYDKVRQHRIGWARELPPERDFIDHKATVINRISFGKAED